MDKVKRLLEAGLTLSQAVRVALGSRSLRRIAIERGVAVSELSAAIGGTRLASEKAVIAMVAELGGTPDEWRQLFSHAMQRRAVAAVGQ